MAVQISGDVVVVNHRRVVTVWPSDKKGYRMKQEEYNVYTMMGRDRKELMQKTDVLFGNCRDLKRRLHKALWTNRRRSTWTWKGSGDRRADMYTLKHCLFERRYPSCVQKLCEKLCVAHWNSIPSKKQLGGVEDNFDPGHQRLNLRKQKWWMGLNNRRERGKN